MITSILMIKTKNYNNSMVVPRKFILFMKSNTTEEAQNRTFKKGQNY